MEKKSGLLTEKVKYFLTGAAVGAGMFFLLGAANNDVVIDNGRYQLAAWGDAKAHGAFIIDTVSGETKIAYRYKDLGNSRGAERNNLNKPFSKIR
jgi:hypothetical protein